MNNNSNKKNTITSIISQQTGNIDKCRKLLGKPLVPMFYPKDIIVGMVGTNIPWIILLIIVGIIIAI